MKLRTIAATGLFLAISSVCVCFDVATQPNTWENDVLGLSRMAVHMKLGSPAADFFDMKGFDGYVDKGLIGTRTFTVRYGSTSNSLQTSVRAISTKRSYCLHGFDYCFDYSKKEIA